MWKKSLIEDTGFEMVSRSSSHEESNTTTNIFRFMFLEYGMGWWSLSAAGLGECVHWKLRPCVLGPCWALGGPFLWPRARYPKKGAKNDGETHGECFCPPGARAFVSLSCDDRKKMHRHFTLFCTTKLNENVWNYFTLWFKWLMNSMDVDQLIGAGIWDGNGDGIDRMAMKNVEIFHVLGLMGDGWNL